MSTKETTGTPERPRRALSRRTALKISAVAGLGMAFGGIAVREILRLVDLREVRETRRQLGTSVTISVRHTDSDAARSMIQRAFGEMERLESLLSRHRTGTALDLLNTSGSLAAPPSELVTVLRHALEVAERTNGAFDPTVAPVLAVYEEASRAVPNPPDRLAVDRALGLVDYRALRVTDRDVWFERPGMRVTLDGIAKGFVIDRVTTSLITDGAERVMVEAGGDLAGGIGPGAGGGDGGSPWRLAIQDPRTRDATLGTVSIAGEGLASSGDYVQSFTADRSLHHILDPRTGHSPLELAAATVIAPSAMQADALSTAAMVLGADGGVTLFESIEGVEGLLVRKDGRRIASAGLGRYLTRESA